MYVRGSSRVCAHAIAVQNVFTVVLRVAEKHFIADATIPDSVAQIQGQKSRTAYAGKADGEEAIHTL